MLGSAYCPQRWNDIEAGKVETQTIGTQATITASTVQNVDIILADDAYVRVIELRAKNHVFGDSVTAKIVDIDGVYFPAGTVIKTPILNYGLSEDRQQQANYEAVVPQKIPGGVYLRATYTSTGASDVSIILNLITVKLLV